MDMFGNEVEGTKGRGIEGFIEEGFEDEDIQGQMEEKRAHNMNYQPKKEVFQKAQTN